MDKKLVSIFYDYFVNPRKAKRYMQVINEHGVWSYQAQHRSLRTFVLERHLLGEVTLATCNLDDDNNTRFMCVDSDDESGKLDILDECAKDCHWLTVREGRRPGKHGHLWLLLTKPIPGELAYDLIRVLIDRAGLKESDFDRVFPMQKTADNFGSCVKLPLAHHKKPDANGAVAWFDGVKHDVNASLLWVAEQQRNDADKVIELALKNKPAPALVKEYRAPRDNRLKRVTFDDVIRIMSRKAKPGNNGWYNANCPCSSKHEHGDANPSFGFKRATDGGAIVKCQGGCLPKDIYCELSRGGCL